MPDIYGLIIGQTLWSCSRPAAKILTGARAQPP